MKKLLLLILGFLICGFQFISCASGLKKQEEKSLREVANYTFSRSHCSRDRGGRLPQHHIFFVHGLGGNAETFGFYPENVDMALNASTCFDTKTYRFLYDTGGESGKSVFEFAKDFDRFVSESVKSPQRADKISIVGHSQGGVIGMIWLYHAYSGIEGKSQRHGRMVKNFVSLGTPYWGSRLAYFAFNPFGVVDQILNYFNLVPTELLKKMNASTAETKSLDPQNGQYVVFQEKMTELNPKTKKLWIEELQKDIRFYSIGGVMDTVKHDIHPDQTVDSQYISLAKVLRWFYPLGKKILETDLAVSLPSSRLGFLSFKDHRENYPRADHQDSSGLLSYHELRSTHYVVDAPHVDLQLVFDRASRTLDMEPRGMAYMAKKCEIQDIQNCLMPQYRIRDEAGTAENLAYHPTFYMVSSFLAENSQAIQRLASDPQQRSMANNVGLFMVDFYLRVPKDSSLSKEDISLDFEKKIFETAPQSGRLLAEFKDNSRYFYQLGSYQVDLTHEQRQLIGKYDGKIFRLSLYGFANNALTGFDEKGPVYKDIPIRFGISAKGHRSRSVEIFVRPTYTSIVDLSLQTE